MNKEYMLKLSRELIDAFLNKGNITLGEEHYFMFTITKFLLAKENIIKKNSSNNKQIEFDLNNEYLSTILFQYHQLYKDIEYEVDGEKTLDEVESSVILKNITPEVEKDKKFKRTIKEAVWTIDKIRDSFAHGKYEFDIKNHRIVIDNEYDTFDYQGHIVHHKFKCNVIPELLSLLGREKHSNNLYGLDKYADKIILNKYEKDESVVSNNILLKYKIKGRNFTKDNGEKLENNHKATLSTLSKTAFLHNKAIESMSETMKALGIDKVSENNVLTSILYNHLLLLMSDETREYDYENLVLTDLDYKFAPNKDERNKNDDITNTIGPIKRAIKSFSKQYKKINDYEKVKRCRNIFKNMYETLKEQFSIRNKSVVKRIRNSIMHGNIEIKNGVIKLFDRGDNTTESIENQFECITDNEGLLDFIDELENKRKYTLRSFLIYIEKFLTSCNDNEKDKNDKLNEIFYCLKVIDNNINLDTSMSDIMDKILLADLKDKREQLVNVLRNIKDKKEEEVKTEDKGITL